MHNCQALFKILMLNSQVLKGMCASSWKNFAMSVCSSSRAVVILSLNSHFHIVSMHLTSILAVNISKQ